jgi:aminomethyltransferase
VQLDKAPFVGHTALRREFERGAPRQIVGLVIDWQEVEALYDEQGLPPQVPATASRVPVPVYRHGAQVGKATSTTWSPILKQLIALATVQSACSEAGSRLHVEVTVEAVRHRVSATVVKTPFFNPRSKTRLRPPEDGSVTGLLRAERRGLTLEDDFAVEDRDVDVPIEQPLRRKRKNIG